MKHQKEYSKNKENMNTERRFQTVMIQILGALLLAFLISTVFGKRFIPWLEKKGIIQPLKKQVKEKVYSEKNEDSTVKN